MSYERRGMGTNGSTSVPILQRTLEPVAQPQPPQPQAAVSPVENDPMLPFCRWVEATSQRRADWQQNIPFGPIVTFPIAATSSLYGYGVMGCGRMVESGVAGMNGLLPVAVAIAGPIAGMYIAHKKGKTGLGWAVGSAAAGAVIGATAYAVAVPLLFVASLAASGGGGY
jgi:hypothetical protein